MQGIAQANQTFVAKQTFSGPIVGIGFYF